MLIEGCKHELELTVPVEDVATETERIVADLQKKARLPGFRPAAFIHRGTYRVRRVRRRRRNRYMAPPATNQIIPCIAVELSIVVCLLLLFSWLVCKIVQIEFVAVAKPLPV